MLQAFPIKQSNSTQITVAYNLSVVNSVYMETGALQSIQ